MERIFGYEPDDAGSISARSVKYFKEILVWLEEHGYNMELESVHPKRRIEELRK